jgi:ABC-type cobalamin/Fe3+-siderophores transport system ATPase subunit
MRLDKVYINGFKNLKQLEVDFDESRLTTVLIGQNGAGKSNFIEALALIFSHVDLRNAPLRFSYRVTYRIQARKAKSGELTRVVLSNVPGEAPIKVDGNAVSRAEFERNKSEWFPDLILGYYSGSGRRLERVFDKHQSNYYKAIARNNDEDACYQALLTRRLFYCRQVHGVMALLAQFAFPDEGANKLLKEIVRVTGFHSTLALFREPWYAKGGRSKKREDAANFWGADGPAGRAARQLQSMAFHPFGLTGNAIDDYRDKLQDEAQFAIFLRDQSIIQRLRHTFSDDADMFYALEALDVSDLIRSLNVWVTRENEASGDIEFSDLSDGERQLLMVMGLLRISRGKRVLFLLDEPDTHLNPHWQLSYLRLIEQWTGTAADAENSHIVLTSHNPLTISALTRNEVRVITQEVDGRVTAGPPYADPKGMGFTATLTEIFGLATSLDVETQRQVDERNELSHKEVLTEQEALRLAELNAALAKLGFLFDSREPLYKDFLRSWHDLSYADRPAPTAEQALARRNAMKALLQQLMNKELER